MKKVCKRHSRPITPLLIMKYLIFVQMMLVFHNVFNGGSTANAKAYQGFHDDKIVEEHCSRTTLID